MVSLSIQGLRNSGGRRRYNLADGSWHDFPVLVLIVIAAIVILAVVVSVAMGRGGGLSAERSDYLPLDLGPVSATDVALLRPPTGVWGYNMQVTDEAMEQIAESIRERDVRIVALEQLVTDLSRDQAPAVPVPGPYAGARHRRAFTDPDLANSAAAGPVTQPPWSGPPWSEPAPETPATAVWTPGSAMPATGQALAEEPRMEPLPVAPPWE